MIRIRTELVRKAACIALALVIACALSLAAPVALSHQSAFADSKNSSTASSNNSDADQAHRVVKVGYMDQKGVLSRDENGEYSGYTYDYLIQIAQFTGWTYEFVEAPGETAGERAMNLITLLNDGAVDIEGGMAYSSALATMYEYPKNSYGTTHTSLFAPADNQAVSQTNLYTQDVLRVAILSSAKQRRAELERFCEVNKITLETIDCATTDEMKEKTLSGEADVFLEIDINIQEGFIIAASFDARPYFFGAPKGQRAIIDEIDTTIARINESNPTLQSTLYEKYFNASVSELNLTPVQAAFAEKHETLRVGVIAEKAPLQSLNNQTGNFQGVSMGVLDYLSEKQGFHLRL